MFFLLLDLNWVLVITQNIFITLLIYESKWNFLKFFLYSILILHLSCQCLFSASKGFLHASHFCYMMAHVNFGSYQKKTAKMVLVGSNHRYMYKILICVQYMHVSILVIPVHILFESQLLVHDFKQSVQGQ